MVNSKAKGKGFERDAARLLSILTGATWRRVPNSGAMATANQAEGRMFEGDLFTEEPSLNYMVVECKITGKVLNIETLLSGTSKLWAWWTQAKTQAKGKMPLLIFRYHASPAFALMEEKNPFKVHLKDGIGIVRGDLGELVLGRLEAKP